jgi:hypothetical protein
MPELSEAVGVGREHLGCPRRVIGWVSGADAGVSLGGVASLVALLPSVGAAGPRADEVTGSTR